MTSGLSHLDVIDLRLSHERTRVAEAKTEKERAWRQHNVRMIERERENEIKFLAAHDVVLSEPEEMTLDEILTDLAELDAALTKTGGAS